MRLYAKSFAQPGITTRHRSFRTPGKIDPFHRGVNAGYQREWLGVSSAMGCLQGLVSTERDGDFVNCPGQVGPLSFCNHERHETHERIASKSHGSTSPIRVFRGPLDLVANVGQGPSHCGFCVTALAGQPNKPTRRSRELSWKKRSARKKRGLRKQSSCEHVSLAGITRSEVSSNQATTEERRRRRRTTKANEPKPRNAADAGSGTAAGGANELTLNDRDAPSSAVTP